MVAPSGDMQMGDPVSSIGCGESRPSSIGPVGSVQRNGLEGVPIGWVSMPDQPTMTAPSCDAKLATDWDSAHASAAPRAGPACGTKAQPGRSVESLRIRESLLILGIDSSYSSPWNGAQRSWAHLLRRWELYEDWFLGAAP